MALYYYQAYSRDGKKITGTLDAVSNQSVREQLARQNLYPIAIELASGSTRAPSFFSRIFQRSISLKDKIFFTKQLSVLLRSGIPLVQALELLIEQTEGRLQSIIIALKDGIKEGRSMADGLAQYPQAFDSIYVQLVRAGEATGKLETILDRLTNYLTKQDELKKKVSAALRYPIIQLSVIVIIVIALLNFVVPQIATAFTEMNIDLPLPTRILIGMSRAMQSYWWLGLLLLIVAVIAWRLYKASKSGAIRIDALKLKLPIVGYFAKSSAIVQFCQTLGMLLEGGVNLSEALSIVVKIIDNKVLAQSLEQARENIIRQGKIAQYLKETGLFPPVAIYLINTGEQSGELAQMLLAVAKYYEDEVSERADGLSALISPIMLIVMASVVGFIILAILLPIQKLTSMAENIK